MVHSLSTITLFDESRLHVPLLFMFKHGFVFTNSCIISARVELNYHKFVKHYSYAVIVIDCKLNNCFRFTFETEMGSMPVIFCAVELRRKPGYYVMHLILPAVTLSSVSTFVFALPVESGEKISLGISVLLSYSVISLLVADNMPTNGDAIPVLCRYPACVISFLSIFYRR